MSTKNNPNINSAGLSLDIIKSIKEHIRGNAKKAEINDILNVIGNDVVDFCIVISEKLDKKYNKK